MARNNIRKYKKTFNINIGMILFGMIFIYILAFGIFRYMNSKHISVYEVVKGSLRGDNSYNAFAVRDEKLYTSSSGGTVSFYAKNGSRISFGQPVYTLDTNGTIANMLSAKDGESTLSDDDFKEISDRISSFKRLYNPVNFGEVYEFKDSLNSKVLELLNINILSKLEESSTDFSLVKADMPGIISYAYDGLEGVTEDNFTAENLDMENYTNNQIKSNDSIKQGDYIYKLITNEEWHLIIEADEKTLEDLGDSTSVQIHFIEDDTYVWSNVDKVEKEGKTYLVFKLRNSVIRYADKRFIKVEINFDNSVGLKVPKSSIAEEDFYTVPKEYLTYGANSDKAGFNIEVYDKEGTASADFKAVNITYSDEDYFYVSKNQLSPGDYIIKPESTDRYQIGSSSPLTGVYSVNLGYAVFKPINIIKQNDEFCIIQSGTKYGLAEFDHIVLDSNTVEEDDILN